MHWKDLRANGETEERLYSLAAWRECPYLTGRERAALVWTEALTLITLDHAPDSVYEQVRPHFSEKELSDLTYAVVTINAWNHLTMAARTVPGTDQPATAQQAKTGN
jgi:alkylhydroperoxidase family enzyme